MNIEMFLLLTNSQNRVDANPEIAQPKIRLIDASLFCGIEFPSTSMGVFSFAAAHLLLRINYFAFEHFKLSRNIVHRKRKNQNPSVHHELTLHPPKKENI